MSANFYNKHRKIIGVILVALFVAGGACFGQINDVKATVWDTLKTTVNNVIEGQIQYYANILGNIGTLPSTVDTYKKVLESREYFSSIVNDTTGKYTNAQKKLAQQNLDKSESAYSLLKNQVTGVNNTVSDPEVAKQTDKGNTLGDLVGRMVSWVLYGVALGLGYIFMLATKVMLYVATFNKFLDQPAVQAGWTITRDVCNNFFIVFIMIMAIGTILQLPTTQWRNMLPKIILAAVLINFSMMFTGILIDVSQIIMLTFASPLASTHAYNIILAAFGLPNAYQFEGSMNAISSGKSNAAPAGLGWWDIIAALMFAILVTIIAICVVVAIAGVLVYRIVVLWFLVILSPLWIFGKAFDKLSMLTSEWMGQFTKYFIVGPAMMFFVYLSFLTMANMNFAAESNVLGVKTTADSAAGSSGSTSVIQTSAVAGTSSTTDNVLALSKMASVNGVINFMIVCGLLLGSLVMGQRYGGAGAKFAGKGLGWAKSFTGANLAKTLGGMGAKRGKELLGDVTRFTVAKGAVNKYFGDRAQMRQKARAEKIDTAAGNIAVQMSKAKKKAAYLPQQALKGYRYAVSGRKIDKAKADIATEKTDLDTKEEELKRKQDTSDKAKKSLKELEEEKRLADNELNRQRATATKLGEFAHKGAGIAAGSFTMGTGADQVSYTRNTNGTWKKTDAAGRVLQNNIDNDFLQENATGYKDDFDEKRIKAERALAAGKTDEAFFEEGQFRYERQTNGTWNKVNKTTGALITNVTGANLRSDAGRRAVAMEQLDDLTQARADVASLDSRIAAQQAASHDADEEAAYAQRDVHAVKANIENKEEEIRQAQRRQAAVDKIAKIGLYGAAAVAGAATGGLSVAAGLGGLGLAPTALVMPTALAAGGGALGGLAAGKGALGMKEGIENAGKADAKLASNMNANGIKAASEGLKDSSDGDILARMDDPTLSKFDRIALQMEAMNRELLSVDKARAAKDEILKKTSDYRGDNDKKVSAMLNAIMEKKYRSLTSTFTDYMSADPSKKIAARKDIDEGIMSNHYKMDDMDNEALKATVERFAEKLGFKSFKSQFDKLSENQKELVKKSLIDNRSALSDKALGTLAKLTNISDAFGGTSTAQARSFVSGLKINEVKEILEEGTNEQRNALIAVVGGSIANLNVRVQTAINKNTPDGLNIRAQLGL